MKIQIYIKIIKTLVIILPLLYIIFYVHSCQMVDSCLDLGGVWDDNEKRCRNDCLTWQKNYGCIKLTPEQIKAFNQCEEKDNCPSQEVYYDICMRNLKAWDKKNQECYFDFTPRECYHLKGDWKYPEICKI